MTENEIHPRGFAQRLNVGVLNCCFIFERLRDQTSVRRPGFVLRCYRSISMSHPVHLILHDLIIVNNIWREVTNCGAQTYAVTEWQNAFKEFPKYLNFVTISNDLSRMSETKYCTENHKF